MFIRMGPSMQMIEWSVELWGTIRNVVESISIQEPDNPTDLAST